MGGDKIFELIVREHLPVAVRAGGRQFTVHPEYNLKMPNGSLGPSVAEYYGYTLLGGGFDPRTVHTKEEIARLLQGAEFVHVFGYTSYADYLWATKLLKVRMDELVGHYLPIADAFSVNCTFNDGFSAERKFGIYGVGTELGEAAYTAAELSAKEKARHNYEGVPKEYKLKYGGFEEVFKNIQAECEEYAKGHLQYVEANGGRTGICEDARLGLTRYKCNNNDNSALVSYLYYGADFLHACRYVLEQTYKNTAQRPLDCELSKPANAPLKPHYLGTRVVCAEHEEGVRPDKVHMFGLNKNTVDWLLGFDSDYVMGEFFNLAFYRGGKQIYASVTEEYTRDDLEINARKIKY